MIRILTACIFVTSCIAIGAPTALTFEVASIKPGDPGDHASRWQVSPSETIFHNCTLRQIVEVAYGVKGYSLSRPDWLDTTRFDVNAKNPPELGKITDSVAREAQFRAMMQTLLAERFKVTAHRETRVIGAFSLVVAKGGLRIQPVQDEGKALTHDKAGLLTATQLSMERLAKWLGDFLDCPVVDKTGIADVFTSSLKFSPERLVTGTPGDLAGAPDNASTGPTIFTALQEQIGLRLQSEKLPVEIAVIDHIERTPTEN